MVLDLKNQDLKRRTAAADKLRSEGTNALPTIFQLLGSDVRAEGEAALEALLVAAPDARQAQVLPQLVSLLVQTNAAEAREWAAIGLGRYGVSAMAPLLELSRNPDPTVRWLVTEQLMFLVVVHKLTNEAPQIISAITDRMDDPEFRTRRLAVWALGVMAKNGTDIAEATIERVIRIVESQESLKTRPLSQTLGNPTTVREMAIRILPQLAKRHPERIERFRRSLALVRGDQYSDDVQQALKSLGELEGGGEK